MSDDLVKRLRERKLTMVAPDGKRKFVKDIAADRIEKLEEALRYYVCDCPQNEVCHPKYCGHVARQALEK